MDVTGGLKVSHEVLALRTINSVVSEAINTTKQLEVLSEYHQKLSAAANQDVVMPDATTLPENWSIIVDATGASALTVKDKAASPVTLQVVEPNQAFEFILLDKSTTAGQWEVKRWREQASNSQPHDFVEGDWTDQGNGYFSLVVASATHGQGNNPRFEVQKKRGTAYAGIIPHDCQTEANGEITVLANAPFDGRLVF